MSFGPELLRQRAVDGPPGRIEYKLARNAVVRDFKRGRLARVDVCDAHPELLRAARNVGQITAEDCPICESERLVLVSFAFGSRLPAGGRCLASHREVTRLSQRRTPSSCYVVEVCPSCSWNHLSRMFVVGGRPGG